MSIQEHKQSIMKGDGRNIMDIFADEITPMLERLIWKAYQSGDSAEIGRTISNYMDGLVFSVAADLQDIEDLKNLMDQSQQERRA